VTNAPALRMTTTPSNAPASPAPAIGPLKSVRALGFSIWSGGLVGALAYLTALPLGGQVSVPEGVILSFLFGTTVGIVCSPFVIVALRTRDLTAAKPVVLWSTAVITCCLAWFLPERHLFTGVALVGGVFLLASVVAHGVFPRVWDRPGLCRYCGYDIRASLEFGRCPECGDRFDRQPWYARRRADKTARSAVIGIASRLVRSPSLPLIVVMLARLAPMAYGEVVREVRCRHVLPALEKAVAGHEPFDLRACTSFPWEKAYIFGPYTGRDTIEKTLGFSWPMADRTGISMSESFSLLVFVHDHDVAAYLEIPRRWDFTESLVGRLIAREDAVFLFQEKSPGYYVLVPSKDAIPPE